MDFGTAPTFCSDDGAEAHTFVPQLVFIFYLISSAFLYRPDGTLVACLLWLRDIYHATSTTAPLVFKTHSLGSFLPDFAALLCRYPQPKDTDTPLYPTVPPAHSA